MKQKYVPKPNFIAKLVYMLLKYNQKNKVKTRVYILFILLRLILNFPHFFLLARKAEAPQFGICLHNFKVSKLHQILPGALMKTYFLVLFSICEPQKSILRRKINTVLTCTVARVSFVPRQGRSPLKQKLVDLQSEQLSLHVYSSCDKKSGGEARAFHCEFVFHTNSPNSFKFFFC